MDELGLECVPAPPPPLTPSPRVDRLPRGGMLATAALLVAMGSAAQLPWGSPPTVGLVRLSWRANGERIRLPRVQAADLPAHMRAPQGEEYDVRIRSCDLSLEVDGKTVMQRKIVAPGVHQDRPLSVHEELPLSPGPHKLRVRFASEPLDPSQVSASPGPDREIVVEQEVVCRAGRVVLIGLDGNERAFLVTD